MNSLSARGGLDPHSRRLLVDETEWRDRLNQLADMRREVSKPVTVSATIVATAVTGYSNITGSS
jgi:hypothetical protein